MKVIFEPLHNSFILPKRGTEHAAGWDMAACIDEPITINVGERVAVPLGCRAKIPVGYSVEVLPRSGLAIKNGLTVLNAPGLIDADYRGEWHAIMTYSSSTSIVKVVDDNTQQAHWETRSGGQPFVITPGMKICQIVLRKVEDMEPELGQVDIDTNRGTGGFGSTGV
jgi:dUTP pyrophosphatase